VHWTERPEAEFLDKIRTKVYRVFFLAFHSHLYSFGLIFIFFQTHAPSYIYFFKLTQPLRVSLKEKGGKPYRTPHPLPCGLSNPYINLKFGNNTYAQKPQRNCTFMNSASGSVQVTERLPWYHDDDDLLSNHSTVTSPQLHHKDTTLESMVCAEV
jgi:hypothetical protein